MTCNVNGLRAFTRKSGLDWIASIDADVICLQETRIQDDQLTEQMKAPCGYHAYFQHAQKKGYSGVAIYSKIPPDCVHTQIGWRAFDHEGRFIQADWGKLSIISLYLPSGTAGSERQDFKYMTLGYFSRFLQELQKDGREYIICGDWNIAHREMDIKNWKGNLRNSGFLPMEREWLGALFDTGWVDVFRQLNPNPDQYTWWSNRGNARLNNVGWRIDYQIASVNVAKLASCETIYREQDFSDHAPLIINYNLSLL